MRPLEQNAAPSSPAASEQKGSAAPHAGQAAAPALASHHLQRHCGSNSSAAASAAAGCTLPPVAGHQLLPLSLRLPRRWQPYEACLPAAAASVTVPAKPLATKRSLPACCCCRCHYLRCLSILLIGGWALQPAVAKLLRQVGRQVEVGWRRGEVQVSQIRRGRLILPRREALPIQEVWEAWHEGRCRGEQHHSENVRGAGLEGADLHA